MAKLITMEQFEGLDEISVEIDPSFGAKGETDEQNLVPVGSREHILNLQLVMATTSVNHEYARAEYDETRNNDRKDELNVYMAECREKYERAREELACFNPLVLETFENELAMQKKTTMVHYHA